jgi:RIO kinase 1
VYLLRSRMNDPLAPLLADGVIDEVSARLKSGKEADLWLVRHGGELVAAKVYKARETRNFRNNAGYKEGRQVRNTRTQRAMDRGSRFGVAASEEAWKAKESDALHALHAAGVRVPKPVLFYEGVLLMEVVVDAQGHPAPRLVDAPVRPEDAAALYADLRGQAIRMLCCDLIHGDLSPYNVLVGWNGPVVIDFPQVVGAAHNSQAERFFLRDLENLRRFFANLDPKLGGTNDGDEIWRAYVRRQLRPDFVPSGRAVEPPARGAEAPRHAHRGRPHPGQAARERGPGERRDRPRGAPHVEPRSPARVDERARKPDEPRSPARIEERGARRPDEPRSPARAQERGHHVSIAGARPGDRRRMAPAPEVVRVARPQLPGAGTPHPRANPAAHPPPGAPETHPAQPAGEPRGRRRRRRRRGQA